MFARGPSYWQFLNSIHLFLSTEKENLLVFLRLDFQVPALCQYSQNFEKLAMCLKPLMFQNFSLQPWLAKFTIPWFLVSLHPNPPCPTKLYSPLPEPSSIFRFLPVARIGKCSQEKQLYFPIYFLSFTPLLNITILALFASAIGCK